MGKSRKKGKGKVDFDSFFDSTKPAGEGDGAWHSGVSAMVLDEAAAVSAGKPSTSGSTPAAAALADVMDTQDFVPIGRSKQKGIRMQQQSLKIAKTKRGSRTTTQKKRKAALQEKALARAEKLTSRASKQVKKKQQVAALKTLY